MSLDHALTNLDAATPATTTLSALLATQSPMISQQHTLAGTVDCAGVGVHSGKQVKMRLCPAPADSGITFVRTDLVNGARTIRASWDNVIDTRLCTVIGNDHGGRVATIEHLMAALRACGIDNARIEIDAAEVPVMDGSSDAFVFLIEVAGIAEQAAPRREIEILAPVTVEHQGKRATLAPLSAGQDAASYDVTIDFDRAPIGRQSARVGLTAASFKTEISRARTFGFFEEVEQLRAAGLGLGGSLDNAIVIKDAAILNQGGLRFGNEFARHKVLDAIGDLALSGPPIRGAFTGYCCGHALNNQLLRALFARPEAWRLTDAVSYAMTPQAAIA